LPGAATLFAAAVVQGAALPTKPGAERCPEPHTEADVIEAPPSNQERPMLYWALMFLVVALIAALFGFGGIASTATGIAQILFVVALVMFVASLLAGFIRRNS
jgi:uncharacterized membrane protein YtjA (UPF0391 family)